MLFYLWFCEAKLESSPL